MMTKHIGAGEFKAKCLRLLDEVNQKRTEIVISKRGRPVARLVPVTSEPAAIFGRLRGTIDIIGDIVGPSGEQWEADE